MRHLVSVLTMAMLLQTAPLTAQNLDPQRAKQMLAAIAQADANRDGKTTLIEYRTARLAQFNRAKGADGFLALGTIAKSGEALGRLLADLDANKDGKVSQAEFVNAKPRAWDRIDGDGDGALSAAEIEKARQRLARFG